MSQLIVSVLNPAHSEAVARLHEKAFQNFFLTSLGSGFLKAFYKSIIQSKEGLAIGIFQDGRILGFAIGTTQTSGFYTKLFKENLVRLSLPLIARVIRKPSILKRLMASLRSSSNYERTPQEAVAALLSICVDTQEQHAGLGTKVLNAFENDCKSRALQHVILTTDEENNNAVNAFYQKNGYRLSSVFLQGNTRKMNLYIKEIK